MLNNFSGFENHPLTVPRNHIKEQIVAQPGLNKPSHFIAHLMMSQTVQIKRGKKTLPAGDDHDVFSHSDLTEHHGLLVEQDVIWRQALDLIPAELETYIVSLLKKKEQIGSKPRISLSTIHGPKGS